MLFPIKGVRSYNGVLILDLRNANGVLILYLRTAEADGSKLFLYEVATETMLIENLSYDLQTPKELDYSFCWGYKPTLLSPRSIINELNQDVKWRCSGAEDITKGIKRLSTSKTRGRAKWRTWFVSWRSCLKSKKMQNIVIMPLLDSEVEISPFS